MTNILDKGARIRRLQITRPSHIKPFIVQKLDDALGTSRGKKYITVTEHDQTVSLAPIKMTIRPKITIVSRVIITYGLPHLFHWKNQASMHLAFFIRHIHLQGQPLLYKFIIILVPIHQMNQKPTNIYQVINSFLFMNLDLGLCRKHVGHFAN